MSPWHDDARLVTAQAGAEELEAAAREAAGGSTAWLDRLRTAQLAKAYLEGRRRIPPHLVGALAKRERRNSVRLGSVALRALREQLGRRGRSRCLSKS